jgi:uncharacterized membrane protein
MFKIMLIIIIALLLLDAVYLMIMKDAFKKQIELIQNSPLELNMYAGAVCYIALAIGLYYFIIKDKKPVRDAFLLGLVIYTVYETTTMALFKDWQLKNAVIDSIWGGVLFATITQLLYYFEFA